MTFSRLSLPAAITLAVLAFLPSAQAGESGKEGWLGSVGSFLLDGLGPARTMEDIRREEERARDVPLQPVGEPSAEAAKPQPVEAVKPVMAAPVVPDALPAPDLMPAAAPAVTVAPKPAPAPKPEVKAAAAVAPVPRPAVAPHPVAVRAEEPPAAALPANRIAATASLEQAIRLGGAGELYGGKAKVSSAAP